LGVNKPDDSSASWRHQSCGEVAYNWPLIFDDGRQQDNPMEILLVGAVIMFFAVLASAWLMTFARWFPIKGIDGKFLADYKTMIRANAY
jgi:hypothetical protein